MSTDDCYCCYLPQKHCYIHNKQFQISKTIRNVTKTGKLFKNGLDVMPIYNQFNEGEVIALLAVFRCMTIGQGCERNKRYDKRLLKIPYDQGIEGIQECKLDLNLCITAPKYPFQIIWVNTEWCILTGFSSAEAIGHSLKILQQWSIYDILNKKDNENVVHCLMLEIEDKLYTDERSGLIFAV